MTTRNKWITYPYLLGFSHGFIAAALLAYCVSARAADNSTYSASVVGNFAPRAFVIHGDGTAVVTIHSDGRVTYAGTLDEASKAFWDAVGKLGLKKCDADR